MNRRQYEAAMYLKEGLTDRQVAAKMGITFNTARDYRKQIRDTYGLIPSERIKEALQEIDIRRTR